MRRRAARPRLGSTWVVETGSTPSPADPGPSPVQKARGAGAGVGRAQQVTGQAGPGGLGLEPRLEQVWGEPQA